jgi:hypothetical protein
LFDIVFSRDRRVFTFRSDVWSARMNFFDFVLTMYATQSSRLGVREPAERHTTAPFDFC